LNRKGLNSRYEREILQPNGRVLDARGARPGQWGTLPPGILKGEVRGRTVIDLAA